MHFTRSRTSTPAAPTRPHPCVGSAAAPASASARHGSPDAAPTSARSRLARRRRPHAPHRMRPNPPPPPHPHPRTSARPIASHPARWRPTVSVQTKQMFHVKHSRPVLRTGALSRLRAAPHCAPALAHVAACALLFGRANANGGGQRAAPVGASLVLPRFCSSEDYSSNGAVSLAPRAGYSPSASRRLARASWWMLHCRAVSRAT